MAHLDADVFTAESIHASGAIPLGQLIYRLLSPTALRKTAVAEYLNGVDAATLGDFTAIPLNLMDHSLITPPIPNLGVFTVQKLTFFEDPNKWTMEAFNIGSFTSLQPRLHEPINLAFTSLKLPNT